MASYIDWLGYTVKRLAEPTSYAYLSGIHGGIKGTYDRIVDASKGFFARTADDLQLKSLAADAFLPSYTGESPARIRARLLARNEILSLVGQLAGITRIAQLYFPSSVRITAFTRQGRWDQRTNADHTSGQLGAVFDWDSAAFPGGAPNERKNDVFLAIEGPFDFAFSTALVGRPVKPILRDGETVGFTGGNPMGVFESLRIALSAHRQFITQIPCAVLLDPSSASGTYFNPAVPASLPTGQFGRMDTRPSVHRYTGSLTQD